MNELLCTKSSIGVVNPHGIKINGLHNIDRSRPDHYLVYKVTNLLNGMYYYGQHTTSNPLDDYMGSGLLLENAKNKYGVDNFLKTILFDFDNREDMNRKEIELLPTSSLYHNNPMCYNLAAGGNGGNLGPEVSKKISEAISGEKNGMYGKKLSPESLQKISEKLKGHPNYNHGGWSQTEDTKRRISESHIGMGHTEESKQKLREARAKQTNLVLDSQKGKHWYYDPNTGNEALLFDCDVPNGWVLGRIQQATKGRKYYNNGITDVLLSTGDTVPDGFVAGRRTVIEYTPERNKKISEKLKGRLLSESTKKKLSDAIRGRRWYNNGVTSVQAHACPKGWVPGRARRVP